MVKKIGVFFTAMILTQPVVAVDLETAVAAFQFFEDTAELGSIACAAHLGPKQCRRLGRCSEGIDRLKALKIGLPSAAAELDNWMGRSDMNKDCGLSLLGGTTSALFKNFDNLARFAQEKGGQADSLVSSASQDRPFQVWIISGSHVRNDRSGRCLDVGENKDGGRVVIADCGNKQRRPFQGWSIVGTQVKNDKSSRCLDVAENKHGGRVVIAECGDSQKRPFQVWEVKGRTFLNSTSKLCLDVAENKPGGKVVIASCQ